MAAPRLGDTLRLAGSDRLPLDEGERLIGTGKTDARSGAVRWALTDHEGHVTVRLGVGSTVYGSRDDEAGPWHAGPDRGSEENDRRAALRAERDRLEDVVENAEDEPTAVQAATRLEELDELDLSETYPSGHTARVSLADLDRMLTEATPAIAAARGYGAALEAYWDEHDRLEAVQDSLRGVTDANGRLRKWTDAEDRLWDETAAALAAHQAAGEPPTPAGVGDADWGKDFGHGVIRGAWGDVHWRVTFDETASFDLGVVPHGQTEIAGLDDLSGQEQSASLSLGLTIAGYDDPDEVAALVKQLGRVSAAGHAAQDAGGAGGGYAGRRRAVPALGGAWANVVDAWVEALAQPFPPDGAVEELDAYFRGFAGACRQIGEAIRDQAAELYGAVPLVGRLLDHMDQAGDGWVAVGDAGDALVATWEDEHADALRRQRQPRPHEGMLNVT